MITWNVDFMAGHKAARTAVVLSYLSVLLPTPLSSTVLQEVTPRSHDAVLQCDQTECATPSVTDVTAPDKAVYFTLSLTTQDTPVSRVLRVRFSRTESQMCHDMLLLDVPTEVGTVRIGNTHLECPPDPGASLRPLHNYSQGRQCTADGK